jgi:hypothetical protein
MIREIIVASIMNSVLVGLCAVIASSFRSRAVLQTEILAATRGLAGLRGQANSANIGARVLSPHGLHLSDVLVNLAGQKHRHLRAPCDLSE